MPGSRPIPPTLAAAPFRIADAQAAGVTRSQLRGRRYSRPLRGVHVVRDSSSGAGPCLAELCRAARLVLPSSAVFSDETAAQLLGLPTPSGRHEVHVTMPPDSAAVRRAGFVGHRRELRAWEFTGADGVTVTTAARTYVDLAGRIARPALLALGDAAVRLRLATVDGIAAAVADNSGCRGARTARELLDLIDGCAESPMESVLRLLLVDAGLPRPEVNVNIYDGDGEFLARADLLFRCARVVVEYEGDHHRTDRAQFAHDVRRGSRLAAAGYRVLRFTAADVLRRPQYVIATVRAALGV